MLLIHRLSTRYAPYPPMHLCAQTATDHLLRHCGLGSINSLFHIRPKQKIRSGNTKIIIKRCNSRLHCPKRTPSGSIARKELFTHPRQRPDNPDIHYEHSQVRMHHRTHRFLIRNLTEKLHRNPIPNSRKRRKKNLTKAKIDADLTERQKIGSLPTVAYHSQLSFLA